MTTKNTNNLYKTYLIEFPYTCTFTLSGDGGNTEVTIRTRSQELRYGREEKDILEQKELENSHSQETYSKHIIEWVRERLWYVDTEDCTLEFTGTTDISEMTDKDIQEFKERCLNEE